MKRTALLSGVIALSLLIAPCEGKVPKPLPGQRVIVVDERYSALRERPELQAPLLQRLRRGRVVGLLGSIRNQRGERFYRVAVSRNRDGWIYDAALVRSRNPTDAGRLFSLIEATGDDYQRVMLARIFQREFRRTSFTTRLTIILEEALARVSERLTAELRRRADATSPPVRRAFFLSSNSLDRYNRLGILFDYDEETDELRWRGAGKGREIR